MYFLNRSILYNHYTRDACKRTLLLLDARNKSKSTSESKQSADIIRIREIPALNKKPTQINKTREAR
jgi:hypothetical protein